MRFVFVYKYFHYFGRNRQEVRVSFRKYRQFPSYLKVPPCKDLRNMKYTYIGIDLNPTYLSNLIGYGYVCTVSVCMFKKAISVGFIHTKRTK